MRNFTALDLQALRSKFEQLRPEQRADLNYGALVNAGIVTNENRYLFKPDIRKIDHYVDIPNDLKCWMNATLYSIANSSFFDDFLEIDRILEDRWNKRPKANLAIANRVLRSLRETIYEIRLGPHTTRERLANARLRSIGSLDGLSDLDTAAAFYHELFANYDLEQIVFYYKDDSSGQLKNNVIRFKHIPIEYAKVKEALAQYKPMQRLKGHGHIGSLTCNIDSLAGFYDLMYLHALFIMLDPWGATARYLFASRTEQIAGVVTNPRLHDPYQGKLVFEDSSKTGNYFFFFNDWNYDYQVSVGLRDIASKKALGKLIYRQRAKPDSSLLLVAKTRYSTNHMIAEIFNFKRQEWATHTFLGPSQFSSKESAGQNGYKDSTFFYQEKSSQ